MATPPVVIVQLCCVCRPYPETAAPAHTMNPADDNLDICSLFTKDPYDLEMLDWGIGIAPGRSANAASSSQALQDLCHYTTRVFHPARLFDRPTGPSDDAAAPSTSAAAAGVATGDAADPSSHPSTEWAAKVCGGV